MAIGFITRSSFLIRPSSESTEKLNFGIKVVIENGLSSSVLASSARLMSLAEAIDSILPTTVIFLLERTRDFS